MRVAAADAAAVWEVFTNRQAYQGLHYGAVVERVVIQKQRPPIPEDMPDEYSLLMSSCWDAEPEKRPSFSQIVACLELMIDNLTNEAEAAARLEEDENDGSSGMFLGQGLAAAAAAAATAPAGSARFAQQDGGGGSSDQVAAVVSGASAAAAAGAGGSTGGSNASGWQQQQRVVYPVPLLPPVAIAGRPSTSSQSGQHVGLLTPTQLQQQRMQQEQAAAGQERNSAGRLAAAGAAGGAGGGHVTPHTTHSTGSQLFASGANVLDSNQYLQDL
jgi:sterile alpha motif and leucine zipper-containing kinase AZK